MTRAYRRVLQRRWAVVLFGALVATMLTAAPATAANGTIRGVVTAAGVPVDHFHVDLYDASSMSYEDSEIFDSATGAYSLSVSPGTYKVCFSDHNRHATGCLGGATPSQASNVVVGDGASVTANYVMLDWVRLTGTLTSTRGGAAAGAGVQSFLPERDWSSEPVAYARADGTFSLRVRPSTTVVLRYGGHVWKEQYWQGKATHREATRVSTPAPGGTSGGFHAVLEPAPAIKGTVAFAAGRSTSVDRMVHLINPTTNRTVRRGRVSGGSYAFHDVPTGTYAVAFARVSGHAYAPARYHSGITEEQGVDAATPITYTHGTDLTVPAATLPKGGEIQGRIVDAGGRGIGGCWIYSSADSLVDRYGRSRQDGTFSVPGLGTSAYSLRVWCGRRAGYRYFVGNNTPLSGSNTTVATITTPLGGTSQVGSLVYPRVQVTGEPTLTGNTAPGGVMSVNPGTTSPASTVTYVWHDTSTGTRFSTTQSATVPAVPAGSTIRVTVRYTAQEYMQVVRRLTFTVSGSLPPVTPPPPPPPPPVAPPPPPPPVTPPSPVITVVKPGFKGKVKVGSVLKAVKGKVSPAGVTVKYQWLRNGKKIKKATKAKYRITKKDRRKKLSLRITYSLAGAATVTKTVKVGKVK